MAIRGKFEVGDRVIFRLGERENLECDECDWQLWNTEEEQFLQDRSNQLYRIFSISDTSFAVACPRCHLRVNNRIEGIPILSLKYEHYINGRYYAGFWAYESELTPIDQPNPIIQEGRFR